MSTDESESAWELTGRRYLVTPERRASDAGPDEDQPWPKGIAEDLASDSSLIARNEDRMIFAEKQSAEIWRKRMNREALASAENWDVREVRIIKRDGALAKAIEEAGVTHITCEDYYVLDTDFLERGLALELVMALRKRIESLERSE